jgi:hypothetical protein
MPTIFFSYFLKDRSAAAEFDQRILRDVAPRALAEESVEGWTLHRINSWPGASDDAPDYICVVDVATSTGGLRRLRQASLRVTAGSVRSCAESPSRSAPVLWTAARCRDEPANRPAIGVVRTGGMRKGIVRRLTAGGSR